MGMSSGKWGDFEGAKCLGTRREPETTKACPFLNGADGTSAPIAVGRAHEGVCRALNFCCESRLFRYIQGRL